MQMHGGVKLGTLNEAMKFALEVQGTFPVAGERMLNRFQTLAMNVTARQIGKNMKLTLPVSAKHTRDDLVKIIGFSLAWIDMLEDEMEHGPEWKPNG